MRSLLLLFYCLLPTFCTAQYFSREPVCGRDTLLLYRAGHHRVDYTRPYKAFKCLVPSSLGLRVDVAGAGYIHHPDTRSWLGQYGAGVVGIAIAERHVNIGVKFTLATVHPGRPIISGSDSLPVTGKVNPAKLDYTIGYSFDFKHNLSIEPFIGYSRFVMYAWTSDHDSTVFSLPTVGGPVAGFFVNKYFRVSGFEYIGLFAGASYAYANFTRVNSSLGRGYFEFSCGVAYKGFYKRYFYKEIDQGR